MGPFDKRELNCIQENFDWEQIAREEWKNSLWQIKKKKKLWLKGIIKGPLQHFVHRR